MPMWTEEKANKLRTLWEANKLSAAAIASLLGHSKNSVIGKAHRLKLSPKAHPRARRMVKKESAMPKIRKVVKPSAEIFRLACPPEPQRSPGAGVPFLEASYGQCRAILDVTDDPRGQAIVCGDPVVPEKAWCPYHFSRYTMPPRVR